MCNACVEWGGKIWHRYGGSYYERTDKKRNPKTMRLHREMWCEAYGEPAPGMEVHHRDDDKGNNVLANFELLSKSQHRSYHTAEKPIPRCDSSTLPDIVCACVGCGVRLVRKVNSKRPPRCVPCQRKKADDNRKSLRKCLYCGGIFVSRDGDYCSQSCVNLGARWA